MFLTFSGRCAWTTCSSSVPLLIILYTLDSFSTYLCRREKLSGIVNAVVLGRAGLHGGGGPQLGEVTFGGSPHLTCKRDQIKIRDYMDRRVTPPKRVISPTWGPPPPCKQALKLGRNCDNSRNKEHLNFFFFNSWRFLRDPLKKNCAYFFFCFQGSMTCPHRWHGGIRSSPQPP